MKNPISRGTAARPLESTNIDTRRADDKPNILVITSDQHNAGVMGCAGDHLVRTPNLDSLAATGVLLENLYCPSPLCTPARMSMLTGLHPHEIDVWGNDDILSSAFPTFAHSLTAAGYSPVLVGKMHARGPDQMHGYVERILPDPDPIYGDIAPVDLSPEFDRTYAPDPVSLTMSGPGQMLYEYGDMLRVDAACAYLQQYATRRRGRGTTDPFALTVSLLLPHPPYIARPELYEYYDSAVPSPTVPESVHPADRWWAEQRGAHPLDPAETHRCRAAYWALVETLDEQIGRVLNELERCGLADDTVVVYTSDHGDQLGEHGLFWKHTMREESIKVPGIIRWPGIIPPASRFTPVVSAIDVTATIIDVAGGEALPGSTGRSLLPLVAVDEGADQHWHDTAFVEGGFMYVDRPQRVIRQGPWKLVVVHEMTPQLFNLSSDPHELVDLAGSAEFAPLVEGLMRQVMTGWKPEEIVTQLAYQRDRARLLSAAFRASHDVPDKFGDPAAVTYLHPLAE